jgi:hypothetical protein
MLMLASVQAQQSTGFLSGYDASKTVPGDYAKYMTHRISPMKDAKDSMAFTSARDEPSIGIQDLAPPKMAEKDEESFVPKLLANDIGLSAIGIAFLSFAAMLGIRLRRMAPAPATALLELNAQGSTAVFTVDPTQPVSIDRRALGGLAVGGLAMATPFSSRAYEGVYGMDIVKAKDAVLDEEALASAPVKKALEEFKGYAGGMVQLKAELEKNDQIDIASVLRKDYDLLKVRGTFNALAAVWDEDTQRATDRIMRSILQDLVEVETAAKLVDGKRSPKKLKLTNEKLVKLDQNFRKLFSYLIAGK